MHGLYHSNQIPEFDPRWGSNPTYKTLFTYRHAQYLSLLLDMIQVQDTEYHQCDFLEQLKLKQFISNVLSQ